MFTYSKKTIPKLSSSSHAIDCGRSQPHFQSLHVLLRCTLGYRMSRNSVCCLVLCNATSSFGWFPFTFDYINCSGLYFLLVTHEMTQISVLYSTSLSVYSFRISAIILAIMTLFTAVLNHLLFWGTIFSSTWATIFFPFQILCCRKLSLEELFWGGGTWFHFSLYGLNIHALGVSRWPLILDLYLLISEARLWPILESVLFLNTLRYIHI